MKTLVAGLYVRVSTSDQKHDLQLAELRAYADRMGWRVIEYAEKISGVAKKRPVLERLMDDARLRKLDVVLVWKLDRFGRSLSQLIENIMLLEGYGARFIAVTQNLDTDKQNPAGRLMLHIFGAVAEFERSLIVERVRAGVNEAKRQGKHCGRPSRVFRRDEALRMRASGASLRAISKELGVALSTLADALRSK
jgi:putative DNA-invertase from lambdoid prophage Rac